MTFVNCIYHGTIWLKV